MKSKIPLLHNYKISQNPDDYFCNLSLVYGLDIFLKYFMENKTVNYTFASQKNSQHVSVSE